MPKLQVEQLYKIYGKNTTRAMSLLRQGLSKQEILQRTGDAVGLRDISLAVEEGEIFVVMGLSGSGKSTLLRCINRLIEPTSGQVLLDGENIAGMREEQLRQVRRHKMGMVFQRFALFPHRTVLQNVEFGLEIQGEKAPSRRDKALQVLETVGLGDWAGQKPEHLSGGMQQRVGLARALAIEPELLLMDEPFSALDPLIRREMQNELLDLQGKLAKTIIFITHDLDEALKMGDRIAIMRQGEIVQIGRPEEILNRPADDYVAEFTQDVNRAKVLKARNVMQRPEPVLSEKDGPRVALRQMREQGLSSIFVINRSRRLLGLLTADVAVQAAQEGRETLDGLLNQDYPVTHPDEALGELIPVAATARYPIAVVNEEGVFLGIILRVSVLAGLTADRREGAC